MSSIESLIGTFTYDKEDFKDDTNSTSGFKEYERKNLHGGFGEVGMEFILDEDSGIRVLAQRTSLKTDQFETLGREKLKFNITTVTIGYIQYVETSF